MAGLAPARGGPDADPVVLADLLANAARDPAPWRSRTRAPR
ncbi:hypothetical protein P9209_06360 [Prescottella defluvii]|nr:hypothetical protein P9209_06360 [Prescottella defluvii]